MSLVRLRAMCTKLSLYEQVRVNSARREVSTFCPLDKAAVPKRLWKALAEHAGIGSDEKWGECSNTKITALAKNAAACILTVKGKGAFKEEFVTAGGVSLNDINMKVSTSHFELLAVLYQ
jgi:predicted flavoprotein YhiN